MNVNFSQSSQAYFVVEGNRRGKGDVTCASSEAQVSGASPFLAQSELVLSSHAHTHIHTQREIHMPAYTNTHLLCLSCVFWARHVQTGKRGLMTDYNDWATIDDWLTHLAGLPACLPAPALLRHCLHRDKRESFLISSRKLAHAYPKNQTG